MEIAKTHELTADYSLADKVVRLRLWRRGEPYLEGKEPVDVADLKLGEGYGVQLRLKRAALLERNNLTPRHVLGA